MSRTGVLVCGDAGIPGQLGSDAPLAVVPGLCGRPEAARAAVRSLGIDRVVLGLCEGSPSEDLLTALRGAGTAPFAIEAVVLGGRPAPEAAALLAGGLARLRALAKAEPGRHVGVGGPVSRRRLFSLWRPDEPLPVAVVDEDACVGTRGCGLCAERCPDPAIDVSERMPRIDRAACNACGACVGACPQGAVRLSGASLKQIEAQLSALLRGGIDRVVLACRHAAADAPIGWAAVELPALGMITPGWILQLRARGVAVALAPCDGPCCASADEVQALAGRIVGARGAVPRAVRTPLVLSEPRATTEAVLALALGDPSNTSGAVTEGLASVASPLGVVAIDPAACTVCGACAAVCPTEALRISDTERGTSLRHDPAVCVACGRCVAACPEAAVTVTRAIDAARLRDGETELVTAVIEHCAMCSLPLAPPPMRRRLETMLGAATDRDDLCPACARRSRSLIGSHADADGGML